MKISGKYLLVIVAMCGLLASGVGLVTNVAGVFFDPVASELGIGKGQVSLTLTICNICFALGGMLAPKLMQAKSPKPLLIAATAALAGSTAALSACHNIAVIYALCVVRGFSAGIVGMVFATSVINNWFKKDVGLAMSVAFGCSGIAGAIFTPVLAGVVGANGWRLGYLTIAALHVLLNLPAILFLTSVTPEGAGAIAFGAEDAPAEKAAPTKDATTASAAGPISAALFAIVLAYAIICSGLTGLPQHFHGMAENFGVAGVGALMVSFCMVSNTAGKVLLGALVDRFGARISILAFCGLILVSLALLLFVHTGAAMLVASALFGLCYSLATVGISLTTREVFGPENYTRVYPTCSLGGNMANAAFSSIIGFMYDFSGGYGLTLWVMVAFTLITAGLIMVAFAKKA